MACMVPRSVAGVMLMFVVAVAGEASGATEYACGLYGKPSSQTKKCECHSGWIEQSDAKGVSRCVLPAPPPAAPKAVAPDSYAALVQLRLIIVKEWGELPDEEEPGRYDGFAQDAMKRIEADEDRRQVLRGRLALFEKTAWRDEAEVRRALLADVMRMRIMRAKVYLLDAKVEKQIAEIETRAQITIDDPNASPEAKAKGQALLAKADSIRQNVKAAWLERRRQYVDPLDAESLGAYLDQVARIDTTPVPAGAPQAAKLKSVWYRIAKTRLAFFEGALGPTAFKQHVSAAQKRFPAWTPPAKFD